MSTHATRTASPIPRPIYPDHYQILWATLCWNSRASIVDTIQHTPNIHSYELHFLYTLLLSHKTHTPHHLFTHIHTLPSHVAAEIVAALATRRIEPPAPALIGYKPLFYSNDREELWTMVLKLFAAGYVGHLYDSRSARDEGPHGFEALHVLCRLETENDRAWKAEDPDLTDPNHEWYHETPNEAVAQWVRLLRTLVQRGQKDGVQDADDKDGEGSVFIKLEPDDV